MDRTITLTPEEAAAWEEQVAEIEGNWPAIKEHLDEADRAAAEPSVSGQLRRAIRSAHHQRITLPRLLADARTDWETVGPFLAGGTLPSDVFDRLASALKLELVATARG
ncbi:MAG: hypothetical protein KF777_01575 [Planctomycetaceae bacterium]|nr:hypothetical protein [Planctomycetaceae bacterium]